MHLLIFNPCDLHTGDVVHSIIMYTYIILELPIDTHRDGEYTDGCTQLLNVHLARSVAYNL